MKNWFIIAIAIIGLASCEGKKVNTLTGKMRVINGSYLAGDINIDVDYEKIYATNIEYLNYSLFREYYADTHKVVVKNASGGIISDFKVSISKEKYYTLALYDSAGEVKQTFYEEDFVAPKGSTCKVRFLHFSNNAPAVNINNLVGSNGTFTGFSNGMNSGYQVLPIGPYQYEVRDASLNTILYNNWETFNFQPGYFYTMYLKGNIGSMGKDSLGLFVISNNGTYIQ